MEWRPIETAPRDGTRCILYRKGLKIKMGEYVPKYWDWCVEGWKDTNGNFFTPTHWMPLPEPPNA